MTPTTALYHAKNEYVATFVGRHGSNQATREEAWENLRRFEECARDAVKMARTYGDPCEPVEIAAEEIARIALGLRWGSDDLETVCRFVSVEVGT